VPVLATATSLTPSPAVVTVNSGATVTVHVMQHTDAGSTGTQADLRFDRTKFSVVSVVAGAGYPGATFRIGAGSQTPAEAIAEANASTGVIRAALAFYAPGGGPAPSGDAEFAVVTMTALQNVTNVATLALTGVLMLDTAYGDLTPVSTPDADGDGCTDAQEAGPNHSTGGQRDPLNYWDFYDVGTNRGPSSAPGDEDFTKDHKVNFQDTLIILDHFGHDGTDGHDHDLDRNVADASMPWRSSEGLPGDSVTLTDVLNVNKSFGDQC
jgi:hypothetical protein